MHRIRRLRRPYSLALGLTVLMVACSPAGQSSPGCASVAAPVATRAASATTAQPIPVFTYTVVNTYPHDRAAFTQGLVLDGDALYEGTGLNGQSSLRQVELASGNVLKIQALAQEYFGEGITVWKDQLVQLTWQSHVGFVYDKASFQLLKQFDYPTEGWGLTHDGTSLIMSDGTPVIHFLDPATFKETKQIQVSDDQGPVFNLNELEYVCGEIFANVWQTNRIARIAPETGQVLGWIDLTGLLTPDASGQPVDVLNGIAYDAEHDRLFVTGKLWPNLFEITLTPLVSQ